MNFKNRKVAPKITVKDMNNWGIVEVTGVTTDLENVQEYEGTKFGSKEVQWTMKLEFKLSNNFILVHTYKAPTKEDLYTKVDVWINKIQKQLNTTEDDVATILSTPHHLQRVPFLDKEGNIGYSLTPTLQEAPEA